MQATNGTDATDVPNATVVLVNETRAADDMSLRSTSWAKAVLILMAILMFVTFLFAIMVAIGRAETRRTAEARRRSSASVSVGP